MFLVHLYGYVTKRTAFMIDVKRLWSIGVYQIKIIYRHSEGQPYHGSPSARKKKANLP